MKLHEYQAKQLFASAGIPVPRGKTAFTPEEAAQAYEALRRQCNGSEGFACHVKAQIHAGGRGKAGGVLTARSAEEASAHTRALLGRKLVTKQTGPDGLLILVVLVEESVAIREKEETYLAITIDRFNAQPTILANRQGGMDIEELAALAPGAIQQVPVDIETGVSPDAEKRITEALFHNRTDQTVKTFRPLLSSLSRLFISSDASLIEINPLGETRDGRLLVLDAKMVLDDNALFRHPERTALRDDSQEHALELKASRIGISYVGLDGNIGCLVNGAGLAMATNDIIQLAGGSPANFLDVGGGANVEQVTNAFSIILADPKVRAVLVNIFGGIMRCDWIAQGLLNATEQLDVTIPIVVRLQGTNVEEGRRLLGDPAGDGAEAKRLNLISVDELADAARKVVQLANACPTG